MTTEKREIPECLLNAADPEQALEMAFVSTKALICLRTRH